MMPKFGDASFLDLNISINRTYLIFRRIVCVYLRRRQRLYNFTQSIWYYRTHTHTSDEYINTNNILRKLVILFIWCLILNNRYLLTCVCYCAYWYLKNHLRRAQVKLVSSIYRRTCAENHKKPLSLLRRVQYKLTSLCAVCVYMRFENVIFVNRVNKIKEKVKQYILYKLKECKWKCYAVWVHIIALYARFTRQFAIKKKLILKIGTHAH